MYGRSFLYSLFIDLVKRGYILHLTFENRRKGMRSSSSMLPWHGFLSASQDYFTKYHIFPGISMNYVVTGGAGSRGRSHPLDQVCNVKVVDSWVFQEEEGVHPILESPHIRFVQGCITSRPGFSATGVLRSSRISLLHDTAISGSP